MRISTLVPPAEGLHWSELRRSTGGKQVSCSLTWHQTAQILFIAVIQLAENMRLCLQNVSALGAATVLIQGATLHNNPDCSFDFIRRVILSTITMLLEQLSSQRL